MDKVSDMALIVELATALGVKPPALEKWSQRRRVPHRWRLALLEAARASGRHLDPAAFDGYGRANTAQERAADLDMTAACDAIGGGA